MLRRFFSIHHGNVIHRHDEYRRLLQLGMATRDRPELLSDDYFVDLALWFNLAWIDPDDIASDARLEELRRKGKQYTREDVRYVIGRQRMMASGVPHLYHRLEHDGQVEIMTTPYYHPILPLIIDSRSALRGDPNAIISDPPFVYPDDAAFQIEEAMASHERSFGKKPRAHDLRTVRLRQFRQPRHHDRRSGHHGAGAPRGNRGSGDKVDRRRHARHLPDRR